MIGTPSRSTGKGGHLERVVADGAALVVAADVDEAMPEPADHDARLRPYSRHLALLASVQASQRQPQFV